MGIYHAVVARNIFSVASFRRCHSPPPPFPPTLSIPTWTHQFKADTNSSNRVRAAAVAFLAPHADGNTYSPRLLDRMKKKLEKQKKYLQLHAGNIDASVLLSDQLISDEVIVFDGTSSYPPPPISPPLM